VNAIRAAAGKDPFRRRPTSRSHPQTSWGAV
jgi:hypothetical protein